MKKLTSMLIALFACLSIASCSSKQQENSVENEPENSVISTEEATDASTEAPTDAPTESPTEAPKPTADKITLSGNPDDTFTAEADCYAESDRVTMYFQKGVTIKGDMIKLTEKAMDEITEATGLEYNKTKFPYEEYQSYFNDFSSLIHLMIFPQTVKK